MMLCCVFELVACCEWRIRRMMWIFDREGLLNHGGKRSEE